MTIPAVVPPALTYKALDVCTDAAIECGILSPGETLDGETGQWIFRKLNYLLDYWAAQDMYVYSNQFKLFTLVPGLLPHTIGPGDGTTPATFPVPQRPVRIENASIVLPGGPNPVDIPIPIRDDDWWALNSIKDLASSIPTNLYYSEDWPNGSLYFWPVPDTAYQARLELWTLLPQFNSITDPIGGPGAALTVPPAYRTAMMLTLAETLQPGASKEGNPDLARMAAAARQAVFDNNAESPRINLGGSGMPKTQTRPRFNFLTGQPW